MVGSYGGGCDGGELCGGGCDGGELCGGGVMVGSYVGWRWV